MSVSTTITLPTVPPTVVVVIGLFWVSIVPFIDCGILGAVGATEDPTTSSIFMSSMGSIIGYAFMLPFIAAFTTLLYTDLKFRTENIVTDLAK